MTLAIVTEGWLLITLLFGSVQMNVVPGIGAAESDRICPAQTGLLLAITGIGGSVPTARFALEFAEPHAFVTVSEIVGLPALLKQTWPGDALAEFGGVPPGKVHA